MGVKFLKGPNFLLAKTQKSVPIHAQFRYEYNAKKNLSDILKNAKGYSFFHETITAKNRNEDIGHSISLKKKTKKNLNPEHKVKTT